MYNSEDSDKTAFINFREVYMGGIAPKWLYRSSHPILCGDQDFSMAELAQKAGIDAVLNLVDTEKALNRKAPLIPWYHRLFREGRVIALDMKFDIFGDRFCGKIKNPRRKQRGIEDFSLKSSCMRGNKSPAPPVLRPKGRGIKPAFG